MLEGCCWLLSSSDCCQDSKDDVGPIPCASRRHVHMSYDFEKEGESINLKNISVGGVEDFKNVSVGTSWYCYSIGTLNS